MDHKLLGDIHGFEAGYAGAKRDFKAAQLENWLPAGDSNGQDADATAQKPKSWVFTQDFRFPSFPRRRESSQPLKGLDTRFRGYDEFTDLAKVLLLRAAVDNLDSAVPVVIV